MEETQKLELEPQRSSLDDLKRLSSLINKMVCVEVIQECQWSGWVNSIDPVSKSVILSVLKDAHYETILIPGHAIIDIYETDTDEKCPVRKADQKMSAQDLCSRRNHVVAWLKRNLLPVAENEDSIAVGDVKILPPYSAYDICTENIGVATQIRRLLENIPGDFGE